LIEKNPIGSPPQIPSRKILALKAPLPPKPKKPAPVPQRRSKPLSVPPAPFRDVFWFLWRLDGNRPRQRHATLEAAVAERDRLLVTAPHGKFLIFQALRLDV
jgi:hypothetical protein